MTSPKGYQYIPPGRKVVNIVSGCIVTIQNVPLRDLTTETIQEVLFPTLSIHEVTALIDSSKLVLRFEEIATVERTPPEIEPSYPTSAKEIASILVQEE